MLKHFNRPGKRKKSFSIIIVAEGDEQGGALVLEKKLTELYPDLKIRSTILGHVQRGGSPSARDRILASRLGSEAVKALLDGKTSVTVGIVSDKVNYTPFELAINGKKSVDPELIELAEILAI